jgi:glycosyltransferase involved in cell wall biosynthesis
MPLVSVVMVCHRDSPYLRPAIRSVLEQTWRDLELVFVDNGSELSAADIGALADDPRFRWVRLATNEGIPCGHNAGVAAARGEFIALLDYDDIALPQRIERQVASLLGDSTFGIVSGFAERIDEQERVIGREFCLPRSEEHVLYAAYAGPIVTQTSMARREVFEGLPYRSEFPVAGDLDFLARASERWRMEVLSEVLLRYRWYPAQTTQRRLVAIDQSRAAIQLVTARRRAGRPEKLNEVLSTLRSDSVAETWRRGAVACLREGFPVFAAFQARRSFVHDRSVVGATTAVRLAVQAVRLGRGRERTLAIRMFLTGPVRALRLHPA